MAFRKRNVAIGRPPSTSVAEDASTPSPGIRPSPLISIPVTSTGTPSLDNLLGGHAGLALGSSLLIEESGTTDFAGALLRYYAAEGICQGHVVHVVGVGEGWVRELPGVADDKRGTKEQKTSPTDDERMKIAWRYERLGLAGERALPGRTTSSSTSNITPDKPFSHAFDLTKRLALPQDARINHIPISQTSTYDRIIQNITKTLDTSGLNTIHRLILPSLLSPALYPSGSSTPSSFLSFLHALKSLLRQHSTRVTAFLTLPLDLYPRATALIRWAEILTDGVLELTPFPHLLTTAETVSSSSRKDEEQRPQGMLTVHKIPITTSRGEGGAGAGNSIGEDLAFTLSRRKFVVNPFSLPPMEGDQEAQQEAGGPTAKDMEF